MRLLFQSLEGPDSIAKIRAEATMDDPYDGDHDNGQALGHTMRLRRIQHVYNASGTNQRKG